MRYIGSKVLLLDKINEVIEENVDNAESFLDIFSGTASVARYFKNKYEGSFHNIYGTKNNNRKQLEEFLKLKRNNKSVS